MVDNGEPERQYDENLTYHRDYNEFDHTNIHAFAEPGLEVNNWDRVPKIKNVREFLRENEKAKWYSEQQGFDEEVAALQGWHNCSYGNCHYPEAVGQYGLTYPTVGGPMPNTPVLDKYSVAQAKKVQAVQSLVFGSIVGGPIRKEIIKTLEGAVIRYVELLALSLRLEP